MPPRKLVEHLPPKIRVSLGSAIIMGLTDGKLSAMPTTAYLMTYVEGKCTANCGFCPQAKESEGKTDLLSRVSWPAFPTKQVLDGLGTAVRSGRTKRVCIQALNYPEVFQHLRGLAQAIHEGTKVPISISCQPLSHENIRLLAKAGADRIGIPLDAATQKLFDRVKGHLTGGPYTWEKQFELLGEALKVFGKGNVSTHFIVGLGETEEEMANAIQQCVDVGVLPALFAFTPIVGTPLENVSQPQIQSYRRMQLARFVILHEIAGTQDMKFKDGRLVDIHVERNVLMQIIQSGEPFRTSGCPDCNRPFYNEKPSGPIYNFPRRLTEKEISDVEKELDLIGA